MPILALKRPNERTAPLRHFVYGFLSCATLASVIVWGLFASHWIRFCGTERYIEMARAGSQDELAIYVGHDPKMGWPAKIYQANVSIVLTYCDKDRADAMQAKLRHVIAFQE